MAVRSTMAAIIARVRLLINDPAGGTTVFQDQDIQDVLDQTRLDMRYYALAHAPTYTGSTINYLDYFAGMTDWEDDLTLWQWRINQQTPATSENIVGHWTFTTTVLPPLYLNGKTYDVYRCAADMLERWAAMKALNFDFSADGQSFHRSQAFAALEKLAQSYRMKQRAHVIGTTRSDLVNKAQNDSLGLGPVPIDYIGKG